MGTRPERATRARQLGLQPAELTALEHLVVLGGLTPGELGHRLGLTSGGLTALAGRLIEAGHVQHFETYAEPLVAPTERAAEPYRSAMLM